MYIALISIILFICVLLVLVVLAQNPKGGGLSSQFGGGGASQLMGVKRTGDLLEKLTWGFAIALVVLTLSTHMMIDTSGDTTIRSVNEERARQSGMPAAPAALPGAEGEEDMSIPGAADIPEMVDTAK
ncbi:preprotein translocase subunit SecG [uncultured Pontibacter sp.]|uniref:preprotein translocase subunit SecG n=1 Tax=uncultured Pontibacter sp. TaxID=453356 RepID=UPI0026074AEC|nr:preprotein translocase subunit SecG [uncultured Pontibacter sp.]